MARRALMGYAAAMVVAGALWGWRAPLTWDEQRYYLPAVRYFASELPEVPLDYPMPMPPLALLVQGWVYRITASVAVLRMLSTVAAIGAAAVVAVMLRERDWPLLFMFGTFPAALMNAFSLKHHSIVLLCCVGAVAAWERRRVGVAAALLAAGALTHQITVALIGTLVVLALFERRVRDAIVIALAGVPLAALALVWGGMRPSMHEATFTGEPSISGLQPAQVLVLLLMAGAWIAPALPIRWKPAALALPVMAAGMYAAGLMRPSATVYERLAGPVSSVIYAATRGQLLPASLAAGALAALGAALYVSPRRSFGAWSAMYALVMLAVPYFFESYYALFVGIAWLLLRDELASRPRWFPVAVTLAGVAYVIVKA